MDDRGRSSAMAPEELADLFVARANAGDVAGLVELYEPDAVLALPDGGTATGHAEIRAFYAAVLADRPTFTTGASRPALRHGSFALTSTTLAGSGPTAEVAHQQPDGSWRWIIDRPTLT